MNEPEPGWRPGDTIYVDLPDGPCVRCRIINILEDGNAAPRQCDGDRPRRVDGDG